MDDSALTIAMLREAKAAGIVGNLNTVSDLISNIEKTASESKLGRFLIKLAAGVIVIGQPNKNS